MSVRTILDAATAFKSARVLTNGNSLDSERLLALSNLNLIEARQAAAEGALIQMRRAEELADAKMEQDRKLAFLNMLQLSTIGKDISDEIKRSAERTADEIADALEQQTIDMQEAIDLHAETISTHIDHLTNQVGFRLDFLLKDTEDLRKIGRSTNSILTDLLARTTSPKTTEGAEQREMGLSCMADLLRLNPERALRSMRDAMEHFSKAIDLNPFDYVSSLELGRLYKLADNDLDNAISHVETAAVKSITLDVKHSELAHRYLCDLYMQTGDFQKAEDAIKEALNICNKHHLSDAKAVFFWNRLLAASSRDSDRLRDYLLTQFQENHSFPDQLLLDPFYAQSVFVSNVLLDHVVKRRQDLHSAVDAFEKELSHDADRVLYLLQCKVETSKADLAEWGSLYDGRAGSNHAPLETRLLALAARTLQASLPPDLNQPMPAYEAIVVDIKNALESLDRYSVVRKDIDACARPDERMKLLLSYVGLS